MRAQPTALDMTGRRVAEALGLDPRQLSNLRIEWDGNRRPVARWDGFKALSDDEAAAIGAILSDAALEA